MDLKQLIDRSEATAEWIAAQITHICSAIPPREPGTQGEEEAARYLAGVLKDEAGCERVEISSFEEHPYAFYGWIWVDIILFLIAVGLYFIAPLAAFLLCVLDAVIAVLEFGLYFEFLDPLFPKRTGHSAVAIKKSEEAPVRRVLFTGHVDATWEWTVNYLLGFIGFDANMILGFGGLLYFLVLSLVAVFASGPFGSLPAGSGVLKAGLWGLLFVPLVLALFFLWNRKRIVPGATDNLTGCLISTAILKELKDAGISLKDTEVGVVIAGSEECGLRGSKAFCKQYAEEFSDIPTYIFALDSIHEEKYHGVNYYDLNQTVKTDKELSDLYRKAAEDIGVRCGKTGIPVLGGSTDGAAFVKGGFRATSISAMPHAVPGWYHTRRDTPENLCKPGIAACYKTCIRVLELIDDGALDH